MAKATSNASTNTRSASITVGLDEGHGNAVLAAWQGIYHLFGGQGTFEITPDGVIVSDFSVDGRYDPQQIVTDISHRARRLDLIPTYLWATGQAPEPFLDAKEMTQFMVQYFRGSVQDGASISPKYVKTAVADYKAANSLAKKRGPRKKIFRLENLSELNTDALVGVEGSELAALQAAVEAAIAAQAANIAASANIETPSEVEPVTA